MNNEQLYELNLTYLHSMSGKPQFFLVAPQDLGPCPYRRFGEQMMNVGDLILAMITDEDEDGSFVPYDTTFDECSDSFVQLFAHHFCFCFWEGVGGVW